MFINQGAVSRVDAMTEPRPRLTNTIGSVQQASVVSDDTSPNTVRIRGRIDSSLRVRRAVANTPRHRRERESDQQGEGMKVRGIVRSREKGPGEGRACDRGDRLVRF